MQDELEDQYSNCMKYQYAIKILNKLKVHESYRFYVHIE